MQFFNIIQFLKIVIFAYYTETEELIGVNKLNIYLYNIITSFHMYKAVYL